MSSRRVGLVLVAGSLLGLACSGGPGSVGGGAPNGYERPTVSGYESPGSTPGTGGGGGGGGGTSTPTPGEGDPTPTEPVDSGVTTNPTPKDSGTTTPPETGCPPCDATFACTTSSGNGDVEFVTSGTQCELVDQGVTLDCKGKVNSGSSAVGTWSGSGSTVSISITAGSSPQTVVCTKK